MLTLLHAHAGRFPFCSIFIRSEAGRFWDGIGDMHQQAANTGENPFMARRDITIAATSTPIIPPPPPRGMPARKRLISRLWRTAERQVDEIETRLSAHRDDPQSLERDAKTLAIVTRTVRDLVAIESEAKAATQKEKGEQPVDSDIPRSIDAFRAELAGRLDQLRRERRGEAAP